MIIPMLLDLVARGEPGRAVLGTRNNATTAQQLLKRSKQAAAHFLDRAPAIVGYFGVNSDLFPVALFGAGLAGIPFAPITYRAPDEQLRGFLGRMTNCMVIADDFEVERLQECGATYVVSKENFTASVAASLEGEPEEVDPKDVGVLLFTSATTSEPKVAVLRHHHLVSYIISSVEFLGSLPEEAQLISMPAYHVAAVAALLSSVFVGRRIVYLPAFDPEEWVKTARVEEITHAMVVPTMLARILDAKDSTGVDLPHLRHFSYGGERMPLELVERTMRDLPGVDFVNAYGLTETSSTIAMLTPEHHREAFASDDPIVRARLSSVGKPLPTLEIEIRDVDEQRVLPREKGEIWVRGPQVAGEYVGQNVLTGDGWFRTGDGGWLDEADFLFVDGRLDDIIVRGAENISPGEIEEVLMLHPAVVEAAALGVPDAEWGEAIAAAVVLRQGQRASNVELQAWVSQHLRSTKTPTVIEFRSELPYSPMGKLLRRVLRAELSTGLDRIEGRSRASG